MTGDSTRLVLLANVVSTLMLVGLIWFVQVVQPSQGHRILALDQRGALFLIKANLKKFELLDEMKISEADTWAHLAVSGDELFVRELNALAVYRWQTPKK